VEEGGRACVERKCPGSLVIVVGGKGARLECGTLVSVPRQERVVRHGWCKPMAGHRIMMSSQHGNCETASAVEGAECLESGRPLLREGRTRKSRQDGPVRQRSLSIATLPGFLEARHRPGRWNPGDVALRLTLSLAGPRFV
jgi:hypothetical protein